MESLDLLGQARQVNGRLRVDSKGYDIIELPNPFFQFDGENLEVGRGRIQQAVPDSGERRQKGRVGPTPRCPETRRW
jgi:hypothetical protein